MNTTISNLYKCGINGKVKSIETKKYYISQKSGEIKKGKLKEYSLSTFNKQGNVLDEIYKDADRQSELKNRYDSKGNLKEELVEINLKIGKDLTKDIYTITLKQTYKYDSKGNIIECLHYNKTENFRKKIIFEYDPMGNIIGKYSYNSKGDFIQKEIYTYNLEGKETEYSNYYKEHIINKNTHKYDSQNNLIETNNYSLDNKLSKKIRYKYDNKGNKAEFIFNSNGELEEKNNFKANGKIIEYYTTNSKGNLYLKNQSNYDSDRNLIERYSYDSNNNILTKETHNYEFDQKENWIKDIILRSIIGSEIIIRKIKYL